MAFLMAASNRGRERAPGGLETVTHSLVHVSNTRSGWPLGKAPGRGVSSTQTCLLELTEQREPRGRVMGYLGRRP